MNIQEIKGWTYGFMKRNETQCVKHIVSLQEEASGFLQREEYRKGSLLFRDIAEGLKKLSDLDKDNYELPLYTAHFTIAKIEVFHLDNKEEAIEQLKKAIAIAKDCSAYDRLDTDIAEQDLELMKQLLSKLESGISVSALEEKQWKLTGDSPFSQMMIDNTISGIGCIVVILLLVILCVVYSIVVSNTPTPAM